MDLKQTTRSPERGLTKHGGFRPQKGLLRLGLRPYSKCRALARYQQIDESFAILYQR